MLKLKLGRIDILVEEDEPITFHESTVEEYEELSNGIVIKTKNGRVHKYIGVSYHIMRTPE